MRDPVSKAGMANNGGPDQATGAPVWLFGMMSERAPHLRSLLKIKKREAQASRSHNPVAVLPPDAFAPAVADRSKLRPQKSFSRRSMYSSSSCGRKLSPKRRRS